jgi:hypothetical protein
MSGYIATIRWVFRQLLEKDCEIEAVVLGTRYALLLSLTPDIICYRNLRKIQVQFHNY